MITSMPLWLKAKLFQRNNFGKMLQAAAPDFDWRRRLLFSEYHLSHANGDGKNADAASPLQYASRAWHLLIAAGRELNGKLRVKAVE
jgi:hypothetical protein